MTLDEEIKIQDAEDKIAQELASAKLEEHLNSNNVINISKALKEIKDSIPETEDKEAYEQLISIVDTASRKNENLANIVENAKKIGGKVLDLAKKYFL